MDTFLVTPASEAEAQLLLALFKKMKVKAQVLPAVGAPGPAVGRATGQPAIPAAFVPQNRGEERMLEAVLELREVLAGRKEARSAEEFLQELHKLSGQGD